MPRSVSLSFLTAVAFLISFGLPLSRARQMQAVADTPVQPTIDWTNREQVFEAANAGDAVAQMHVARLYQSGALGVTRDQAQALTWYLKSANQGNLDAEASLASMYKTGVGTAKDENQADLWSGRAFAQIKRAAESGDAAAMGQLAVAFETGFGTQSDPAQFLVWERKAAEAGNVSAQNFLGSTAENKKDYQQAILWYRKHSTHYKDQEWNGNAGLVRIAVATYRPNETNDTLGLDAPDLAATQVAASIVTEFGSMSSARVIELLQNADAIKVDPKGTNFTGHDARDAEWYKACNGTKSRDDVVDNDRGEKACFQLFVAYGREALANPSNSANLNYIVSALLRGCGVYAASADKGDEGRTCGLLGRVLYGLGNAQAARAVWDLAPGCYSQDERVGTPVNGCVRAMTGRDGTFFNDLRALEIYNNDPVKLFGFEPRRLVRIMYTSCSLIHDRESCAFLQSFGATVDMAAVDRAESERHEALQEFRAKSARELEEARAESAAYRNALLDTLRGMPGGSDPNAILNAGNQQAAAIRAIGDANAARQQRDAQMRLASQRTTQPPTGQGSKSVVEPATTYQRPTQLATSSTGAPPSVGSSSVSSVSNISAGSAAIQYSTPLATSCVRQFWDPNNYNWLSFENNCGQAIYVNYIPHRPGGWAMGGGMHLAPGHHDNTGLSSAEINQTGGFDLYVCPTDSVPVDLSGNVFSANVSEYRCKPQ